MKILLAEDDANITVILQICLEKIGHHTLECVADGAAALACALKNNYDLILLDGMMPKMSGIQVMRELHAVRTDHAPVIFLSAKTDTREIAEFLNMGAGHIQKPFDPQSICHRIDQILLQGLGKKTA